MPTSLLKTLGMAAALSVALAGTCAAPVAAVTPDVRLPAWHALEVRVSEWNPAKGEIGIDAELRSLDAPLKDLVAEVHWPKPVEGRGGRKTADALPAGQLWSTKHSAAGLTIPFDGWIELEVRDDGEGVPAAAQERVGLGTTRARLEALWPSASVTIRPVANGQGTSVLIRIPVPETDQRPVATTRRT